MIRKETANIMDIIKYQVSYFAYDDPKLEEWHRIFKNYDYEDVLLVVQDALKEDRFQTIAPNALWLVKYLKPTSEKSRLNSYKVYCPICDRLFNSYQEQVEHFDRCSSVEYIVREYPKWYPGIDPPDKKELYNMPKDEFKIRYLKLLKRIYENTTSRFEKECIANILYPPSEAKAKEFLSKGR